ncbi:MAG: hypothetical protein Q9162_002191 [Coniocarpon cinnabarinum]
MLGVPTFLTFSWCLLQSTWAYTASPAIKVQEVNYQATPGSPRADQASHVIAAAQVDPPVAQVAQVAIEFERSNWATGSVKDDPLYTLPANASDAIPGTILRVELKTNTTHYTVPPGIAMSRFVYQSATLNGTAVPASAFVVWPWQPRAFPHVSGAPVVAWAHGTSGLNAECAPSHMQNLWYQFSAPFTLALQGYAVIGVDYAGLGINETLDGQPIVHQWAAHPAGANDLVYAVQAAREAWPAELSEQFAVFGHSQGGGVAWGVAQRQVHEPVSGYLGAVAASPLTDYSHYSTANLSASGSWLVMAAQTVASIFPEFVTSEWLTPAGEKALKLYNDLSGCQSMRQTLLQGTNTVYAKPMWNESWFFNAFNELIANGGRRVAGPMLVLQGTDDPSVSYEVTTASVNATCETFADTSLQYVVYEGVTHVPALFAGQQTYLNWIADRFMGFETPRKCVREHLEPFRAMGSYQRDINYFLERPQYAYETA